MSVGDEPFRAFGDVAIECREPGIDMIQRINRFADVMQQRCQQELLVVWRLMLRELKDLQAVVQGISLGVDRLPLLNARQRREQHPVDVEPVWSSVLSVLVAVNPIGIDVRETPFHL